MEVNNPEDLKSLLIQKQEMLDYYLSGEALVGSCWLDDDLTDGELYMLRPGTEGYEIALSATIKETKEIIQKIEATMKRLGIT